MLFFEVLWYNNLNNGKVGDFGAKKHDRLRKK